MAAGEARRAPVAFGPLTEQFRRWNNDNYSTTGFKINHPPAHLNTIPSPTLFEIGESFLFLGVFKWFA